MQVRSPHFEDIFFRLYRTKTDICLARVAAIPSGHGDLADLAALILVAPVLVDGNLPSLR